nr:hypothetical protein [Tanacetum cinerariifolium]
MNGVIQRVKSVAGGLLCVTVVARPTKLQDLNHVKSSGNDGNSSFVIPKILKWTGRGTSMLGYYNDLKLRMNEDSNGEGSLGSAKRNAINLNDEKEEEAGAKRGKTSMVHDIVERE